jgi:hypothetical protein
VKYDTTKEYVIELPHKQGMKLVFDCGNSFEILLDKLYVKYDRLLIGDMNKMCYPSLVDRHHSPFEGVAKKKYNSAFNSPADSSRSPIEGEKKEKIGLPSLKYIGSNLNMRIENYLEKGEERCGDGETPSSRTEQLATKSDIKI